MSSRWRQAYYSRVRPVLGNLFFERAVALWDLGYGLPIGEALARTGIRDQRWLDGGAVDPEDATVRSFGIDLCGLSRAEALSTICRRHNTFETDWALRHDPADLGGLRRAIDDGRCAALVARLDHHAPEVCRIAIDAGVPLVLAMIPATNAVGTIQIVWTPRSQADPAALIALCEDLAPIPQLDLDAAESHIDGLEARDLSLALVRWILAPDSPPRPDLEQPLEQAGLSVVLRGQPDWPWAVRFAAPGEPALRRLASAPGRPYNPPARLARGQRLLVIGLGTASLFCAESQLVAREALLLDCKAVSPENPVRQVYGTEQIGQAKGPALAEILARRRASPQSWRRSTTAAGVEWIETTDDGPGGGAAFGHAELRLRARDRASVRRFSELLDAFAPTIAVVGIGRSHDDNFTATAELRRRGIRHVTPTAFPGVSHYKQIVTDGASGPCYDCLQGHLAVDGGAGPTLQPAERDLYYGGTQPATLAETYPSAHSLLRLVRDLSLPPAARPAYLRAQLAGERCCFVGANRTEQAPDGSWLYGVDAPFRIVTYGVDDLVGSRAEEPCPCGRVNHVSTVVSR